ncbi:MAG: segregation ATPase, FtsK/SpoIIIE family, partial [Phycisphaerales bacterium]|nr:segregation ATPase, FtsK/SpoIIIE family [Phycisphaerales bacterium]
VVGDARRRYDEARAALEARLRDGLATIRAPIDAIAAAGQTAPQDWESPEWAAWHPANRFAPGVRFGRLRVDLMTIASEAAARMAAEAARAAARNLNPTGNGHGHGHPAADGHPDHGDGEPKPAPAAPAEVRLALPPPFDLPATLAFPSRASMLVRADRSGRADAIRTVQMVMSRLLVSLPPGRVRFTLLDPVGLGQNFAGFMHLADHDDQLVGGRIWTEADQIDQRLTNLTGHMETVIQKYLRNEFETIDDYNAQAGELAEPYRFLVVSDFPAGFNDESLRRLSSIAASGARCGVYTLVFQDLRQPLPHGVTTIDDLTAHSVTLDREGDRFVWRDPVFQQFPLTVDPPPSELSLTSILDKVGKGAKEAARVEVPFETIAPPQPRFWTKDSGGDLDVPVGRTGATRLQHLRLGKGVAQHVLVAGKTGSGKSTLLHALVTNLAMWYGPDQVEFYLIDFKKGVEFKTYATNRLPHARAIAVESDREFGVSVLQRLDAELTRRGELFRAAGVQDLAGYRRTPARQEMPRTLLIVDEFQEFFSEDDKLSQDASTLLDRLVRQGRAFGIHCLLGSQTIAGASGLPRSTIGQMAVRVALMTSEADSQLILGDNNSAARLLSRPGEAIYNDQGGLVEGNSPFQVAYLSDERKDAYLAAIRKMADARDVRTPAPIVFEGNAPADLAANRGLADLLDGRAAAGGPPRAWVGEPVAIKEATSIVMRRQSGANLLVIGQAEDAAMATLLAALVSLAAQVPAGEPGGGGAASAGSGGPPAALPSPSDAAVAPPKPAFAFSLEALEEPAAATPALPPITAPRFYVLDATAADSSLYGTFATVRDALPRHDVRLVEWRATADAVNEVATEIARRRDAQDLAAPPVFLFVVGLQRYRVLRKAEDDFGGGFSLGGGSDEPKPADPGKQFAEILKEGPSVGVHVLAWADTATAVDRTLDRGSLREFDNRVLFQMSANDSSNLVDSPVANKLGMHRALAYSEEQGVMEKFRPYALPPAAFLAEVKRRLG